MHAQNNNNSLGGQKIQYVLSSGILLKQEETPFGLAKRQNFGLNAYLPIQRACGPSLQDPTENTREGSKSYCIPKATSYLWYTALLH